MFTPIGARFNQFDIVIVTSLLALRMLYNVNTRKYMTVTYIKTDLIRSIYKIRHSVNETAFPLCLWLKVELLYVTKRSNKQQDY